MTFTVDCEPDAEDDLARLWMSAPDHLAVTRASAAIDHLLATDPYGPGHHLAEGLWRILVPPLAAYYSIDPTRRLIKITNFAKIV